MTRVLHLAETRELTALVYELLDAHVDTAQLAEELQDDLRWSAHLDYLRALQRSARELLADASNGVPT
ncbi:MAG TPA: hypothetical protein VF250_02400 [Conexibacter sp.]